MNLDRLRGSLFSIQPKKRKATNWVHKSGIEGEIYIFYFLLMQELELWVLKTFVSL